MISSRASTYRKNCGMSKVTLTQFLSHSQSRNASLVQIKELLKEVPNVELSNKLLTLINEIYLDAEYRQRTCLQLEQLTTRIQKQASIMKEQLEEKPPACFMARNSRFIENDIKVQYQRQVIEAQQTIEQLNDLIHSLQRQNQQLKNAIEISYVDQQTELLIENLTLQLQNQKANYAQIKKHYQELQQVNEELSLRVMRLENQLRKMEKNEEVQRVEPRSVRRFANG